MGLECSVDAVIFTTPFNDTIDEFRYRYNGVHFNTDKAVFYKLYLAGTIEEKELNKEKNSPMHEIVKMIINKIFSLLMIVSLKIISIFVNVIKNKKLGL